MKSAAILHTSISHIDRFAPLIAAYEDRYRIKQYVNEDLLRRAEKEGGLTKKIELDCLKLIQKITDQSNQSILITCSTLGTIADSHPVINNCKILRIDKTLAEKSIVSGNRIAVIYAVETTRKPTKELFDRVCQKLGTSDTKIILHYVPNAWEAFIEGDVTSYNQLIADYITSIQDEADVFALAQASMDQIPTLLESLGKRVLSSPELAVDALIESLQS